MPVSPENPPYAPSGRSTYLLVSLLCVLVFHSLLAHSIAGRVILGLLLAAIPLSGVYALSDNRRHMIVASILGALTFVGSLQVLVGIELLPRHPTVILLSLSFYLFATYVIVMHVVRSEFVDRETIRAASAGYLIIGFTFMFLFILAERMIPGSFVGMATGDAQSFAIWPDLLYFSFVTLTTLGYGDITPVSGIARSLSVLEAVTGVLYIAVVIARLVGGTRIGPKA